MKSSLVLHPKTQEQINRFVARPSHAVLITGATGSGKSALARLLGSNLMGITPEQASSHPYVQVIEPDDKGTLSIEAVRLLHKFLRLKTPGQTGIRRVCIIEQAATLTTEAQNALLKILEEPPADTLLILTAANSMDVLPTIRSRTAELRVYRPKPSELADFFAQSQNLSTEQIQHAYHLSGGLPGLMHALLHDEKHPLKASIVQAKTLLQQTSFERLAAVDTLSKDKTAAGKTVEAFGRLSAAGLHLAAQKNDTANIERWHRIRSQTLYAAEALNKNANAKLVLTNFMLRI